MCTDALRLYYVLSAHTRLNHPVSARRPEFINRLDDFIVFDPLNQDQIRQIVRLHATRVGDRLTDRRMKLVLTEGAVDYLANAGFDPVYGARPVKRAFQRELLQMMAVSLLRGEFEEEDTVVVDAVGKKLILSRGGEKAKQRLANGTAASSVGNGGGNYVDATMFLDA